MTIYKSSASWPQMLTKKPKLLSWLNWKDGQKNSRTHKLPDFLSETRSVKTAGFLTRSRFVTFTNMRRIISTTIRGTTAINPAQSESPAFKKTIAPYRHQSISRTAWSITTSVTNAGWSMSTIIKNQTYTKPFKHLTLFF